VSKPALRKIKLLIFDCDGVLLDSSAIGNRVELEALKTLHIHINEEKYQERFAGVTTENVFKEIARESGVNISTKFLIDVEKKLLQTLEREVTAIPYVYEALQQIELTKAVASNSHLNRLTKLLTLRNLIHFFNGYVFSADMVSHPKPAPDLYQLVARRMLVSAKDCLVIEDSVTGIQAAKSAGMKVLGFINSEKRLPTEEIKLLKAGVLKVFYDMRELPKIIKDPKTSHTKTVD